MEQKLIEVLKENLIRQRMYNFKLTREESARQITSQYGL